MRNGRQTIVANKVTQEDIIKINELYLQYKTYAEVARQTGFSPSTVKKYVVPNFTPQAELKVQKFDKILSDTFPTPFPKNFEEWSRLLSFTDQETANMNELRKEILI